MTKYLLIALFVLLSGCMTANLKSMGAPFEVVSGVPDAKAIAYFYTHDTRGGNACWLMGIDSVRGQCLGFPGYATALVETGIRKISTTPNSPIKIANAKFNFEFKEGQSYYFEYEELPHGARDEDYVYTLYNMAYGVHFGWKLVREEQALPSVSSLKAWQ